MRLFFWIVMASLVSAGPGYAQLATHTGNAATEDAPAPPHRTRLFLKDGSYQVVMSYKVVGKRVQYVSAERGGEMEEVPLELVDLDATKKYEQRHEAELAGKPVPAPALDPELLREEAERATLTPEVATDLHLVAEDSLLALDTWHGAPELVPLMQVSGDLNRQTGHSILRGMIKPNAATHEILQLKGEKAPVQMHVSEPVFYIRMDDATDSSGPAMTVDTGGASTSNAVNEKQAHASRYAIVRVDVRQDARLVASFNTSTEAANRKLEDPIGTTTTLLPGGHWAKVTPVGPLLVGEYCLVEVLGEDLVNLSVWDFGIHPTAPENRDVIHPEKKRVPSLERHSED